MTYTLEVNLPDTPKGVMVTIPGLGAFENGKSHTITEEQADYFRAYKATFTDTHDKDGVLVKREQVQGPTLAEWAKDATHVKVSGSTASAKKGADK